MGHPGQQPDACRGRDDLRLAPAVSLAGLRWAAAEEPPRPGEAAADAAGCGRCGAVDQGEGPRAEHPAGDPEGAGDGCGAGGCPATALDVAPAVHARGADGAGAAGAAEGQAALGVPVCRRSLAVGCDARSCGARRARAHAEDVFARTPGRRDPGCPSRSVPVLGERVRVPAGVPGGGSAQGHPPAMAFV